MSLGTDPIIVAHTGEYLFKPSRNLFHWYKWRGMSPPGLFLHNFWPLTPGVKITKIVIALLCSHVNVSYCGRSRHNYTYFLLPHLVRFFLSLDTLLTYFLHYLESIEPSTKLQALLGMALQTFLYSMVRFTCKPPSFPTPCASMLGTCVCVCFPGVLHIFACLAWVLLSLSKFSANSLSLVLTFPLCFLNSFWPVSGSAICLIYGPETVCATVP